MAIKQQPKKLTAEEMREQIKLKKADALASMGKAKQRAEDTRQALKNPARKYVDMPEPTGDAEVDAAADLAELETGFTQRRKDEEARFARAVDSGYYSVLCFRTREQRDAFLVNLSAVRASHIASHFFDGNVVASHMGMQLPESGERGRNKPPDSQWAGFVWTPEDLAAVKPLRKRLRHT